MPVFVAPLSFVPPVPTWGDGPFGLPDAVVLHLNNVAVVDPTACFELVVELTELYVDVAEPAFRVTDEAEGPSKTKVTDRGALLETDSLVQWWSRRVLSTASLYSERGRWLLTTIDGGSRLSVTLELSEPNQDEIDTFVSHF